MKLLLWLYSLVFESLGLWFVVMLITFVNGITEINRAYMVATFICCAGISCSIERMKEDT